jgi:hypothetical protein
MDHNFLNWLEKDSWALTSKANLPSPPAMFHLPARLPLFFGK